MINFISLFEFQDLVECKSFAYQSREGFLPITYDFKPKNAYGIISDFGCGSWGLATCLGGRSSKQYSGKMYINKKEILPSDLSKYACFISENTPSDFDLKNDTLTPKKQIEHALSISTLPYSINDIKSLFCLSDERFERPLATASGEIWLISIAVNFALGKEIFCYPWLNERDISRFKIAVSHGIIDFLKKENKIIIVPSSQKSVLRKYCDHTILFNNHKIVYR